LLLPKDSADRLILSIAAADGIGGICRAGSDFSVKSVEYSVCLRAGRRGGKEGLSSSASFGNES
jgi:hypothetical protein